uniref:Uncharacterized protein n=1 Tax=Oryza barthii TaxID=65489 RepID=A0A0D3HDW2_9ORYZ
MSPARSGTTAGSGGEPPTPSSSRSASTIVAGTASGYHLLKIDDYSRTRDLFPTSTALKSRAFTIGGHRWRIQYYPNGNTPNCGYYISLFLHLDEEFRLLDDELGDKLPPPPPSLDANKFFSHASWGLPKFIKKEELEKSRHLKDNSFTVRCDVVVITEFVAKDMPEATATAARRRTPAKGTGSFVSVPPSDLHRHLSELLLGEKGADVVFKVGGKTFTAHRCVLAARSPVFGAELLGSMKESRRKAVVRVDDMEAQVFKALLRFAYTDSLPEMKEKDEGAMCQHLLVAADRYAMERLKLVCEEKLCERIDVSSVATVLALAEQHHCDGLRNACFDFLSSPENLKAAMAGDGFEHLSRSCPSLMTELVAMLDGPTLPRVMNHGAMSPTTAATAVSASAIVANTSRGYHYLKIDGYSHTKATPTGEALFSCQFAIGGHRWRICYYPNGNVLEAADYISMFLVLDEIVVRNVKAQFQIRFADQVEKQPSLAWKTVRAFNKQTSSSSSWGYPKFIRREDLEKSEYLRDDSFTIRCDIIVVDNYRAEDASSAAAGFVSVPPSNLHSHLGDLLKNEKGTDVVFEVAGQRFTAHRCVLAARSPVFNAELFGMMMESDTTTNDVIQIGDMAAPVFKALLHFVYTDSLPETMEEREDTMCEHLLVAADRYNLERLKLICEERLCKYIGIGTVMDILALADRHHCKGLKKACFDFLRSPANLSAVTGSESFEHLSRSFPSLMKELVDILGTSHNYAW